MKKLFVDPLKCSGCRYCEMICSFYHEGVFNYRCSRIRVVREDEFGVDYPVVCRQCSSCPCIEVCPVEALKKNQMGTVKVVEDRCIGCFKCVEECFFGAINVHPEKMVPIICDLCGGDLRCVEKCPTNAIKYVDPGVFAGEKRRRYAETIYTNVFKKWRLKKRGGNP